MRRSPGREQDQSNLILSPPRRISMKTFATVALAALLTGSETYAFAQQQNPAPNAPVASRDQGQQNLRPRMSQDDYNRLVDARIAAIKAGLKLSADQERLWGPVGTAIRTSASERYTRMQQFRENRDQRWSMDL